MSAKEQFLKTMEEEHARTLRVLRAYPADKAEYRPDAKCKSARDVAWMFKLERGLGQTVLKGELGKGPMHKPPEAPAKWADIISGYEKAHQEYVALVKSFSEQQLTEKVTFMTGPKQTGEVERMWFCWFLLHDEIHHRGQLSIYLRASGAKVPSIYGPSGDEPWM